MNLIYQAIKQVAILYNSGGIGAVWAHVLELRADNKRLEQELLKLEEENKRLRKETEMWNGLTESLKNLKNASNSNPL